MSLCSVKKKTPACKGEGLATILIKYPFEFQEWVCSQEPHASHSSGLSMEHVIES